MKVWWGTFDLSRKNFLQKQIGPLWVGIKNNRDEWQIYYDREAGWHDAPGEVHDETKRFSLDDEILKERFVLKDAGPIVTMKPALADRPVVTRPATPFYVPPRQSVVIYVSTPLWVKISIGKEPVELTEIPIIRPSDTWFGPDTTRGQLCYASRTSARMFAQELPKRIHRAITPVEIYNEADSHLLLERINLPVPYLELYETAERYLWTQGVKMVRKEDDATALLEIREGPPVQSASTVDFFEPREKIKEKTIIRTISNGFFF